MKISAVIPAYNAEKHIARAIKSVLQQTRPADEIIVVDDGSADKTAEIVRGFGNKVILIEQKNAGVSVARNAGINAATGDWFAFLDADDEWLPEKLHRQSEHLSQNPGLKWTFTNLSWDKAEHGKFELAHPVERFSESERNTAFFEDYFHAYMNGFYVSTITVMVHKSAFETVGMFEPGMKRAQDTDLWFRIAYQYPQIGYLKEPLAIYHLDTPGSSTKINDDVDFMIQLFRRHLELSKQFGRQKELQACVTHRLQTTIRQYLKDSRRKDTISLLSQFKDLLPVRFRREMYFRIALPYLGPMIADAYIEFKRKRYHES